MIIHFELNIMFGMFTINKMTLLHTFNALAGQLDGIELLFVPSKQIILMIGGIAY